MTGRSRMVCGRRVRGFLRSAGASALWLRLRGVNPGAKQEAALPPSLLALLSERRSSRREVSSVEPRAVPEESQAKQARRGQSAVLVDHPSIPPCRFRWKIMRGRGDLRLAIYDFGLMATGACALFTAETLRRGVQTVDGESERSDDRRTGCRRECRECASIAANPCPWFGLDASDASASSMSMHRRRRTSNCGPCRVDAWHFAVTPRCHCR
jgi:hypothetical protein